MVTGRVGLKASDVRVFPSSADKIKKSKGGPNTDFMV